MTCPKCNGLGYRSILKDGRSYAVSCVCVVRERIDGFVGSQLTTLNPLPSVLYTAEQDNTKTNLLVNGEWSTVKRAVHHALGLKYLNSGYRFSFRMVHDQYLLKVWLGDYKSERWEKYKEFDKSEIASNLEILAKSYDLLIIKLGELTGPNRSAPDVLHETIKLARWNNKSVWLLLDPERPWGPQYRVYGSDVQRDIQKNFQLLEIGNSLSIVPDVSQEELDRHQVLQAAVKSSNFNQSYGDALLGVEPSKRRVSSRYNSRKNPS